MMLLLWLHLLFAHDETTVMESEEPQSRAMVTVVCVSCCWFVRSGEGRFCKCATEQMTAPEISRENRLWDNSVHYSHCQRTVRWIRFWQSAALPVSILRIHKKNGTMPLPMEGCAQRLCHDDVRCTSHKWIKRCAELSLHQDLQ